MLDSIRTALCVVAVSSVAGCATPETKPQIAETEQEAVIECIWCEDGPSPAPGTCQEYDCGGSSGVHYYTCCNNCDEYGTPPLDSPEYDGASDGDYCGQCGENIGGGCTNGDAFTCGGVAGQTACNDFCNDCAITFSGACWNWSLCFESCCEDGDPSDGVDGWLCVSLSSTEASTTADHFATAEFQAEVEMVEETCRTQSSSTILATPR